MRKVQDIKYFRNSFIIQTKIIDLLNTGVKTQLIHTSRKSSLHNNPGKLSVTNCISNIVSLI